MPEIQEKNWGGIAIFRSIFSKVMKKLIFFIFKIIADTVVVRLRSRYIPPRLLGSRS